ncbi:MAG: hypothetical protein R2795_01785 [Saprospiraceae bacterium]
MLLLPVMHRMPAFLFARFHSPVGNYLELYLHIAGKTVMPVMTQDSLYQGTVDVLVCIEQDGQIRAHDKYRLSSPKGRRVLDFIDTRRFALPMVATN